MDNKSVRDWYVSAVSKITDSIPKSYSIEEQAKKAFNKRNDIRLLAREMMKDESKRASLYQNEPNKSFEELIKSKMDRKKMTRDEAIKDILKTATTTNANVNKEFGIE